VKGKRETRLREAINGSDVRIYEAVELFAGIGGIRLGFQEAFDKRIRFSWANDFDKPCCKTYEENFGKGSIDCRGINEVIKDLSQIPRHDILLAGFPCQPFSIAGERKGFEDKTRGTLFYTLAKVLESKKPISFMLENVGHFEHHDKGETWKTVREVLEQELGYEVFAGRLNAKYFGVPQNRPRFFMVGFREKGMDFEFPKEKGTPPKLSSILEHDVADKYYLSQMYLNGLKKHRKRNEEKGHGFGYMVLDAETDVAQALVVGGMGRERNLIKNYPLPGHWQPGDTDFMKRNIEGVRKVTPRECARLQGFPDSFKIPVANTQAYRQFANSVAVPVIAAVARQMLKTLDGLSSKIQLSREIMLAETKSA
jgi:DNA (cytosine-5)-methyltransferase 1